MRPGERALRATLVGLAAAAAALVAHCAIDVLGDFLLAHDTYDDVAHGSRAVFLVAIVIVALAAALRGVFELIDRSCTSRTSRRLCVRKAMGPPVPFAATVVFAAVVLLAGMEWFDCALAHAEIDGVVTLFGGSLLLGLGSIVGAAIVSGFAVRRLVRLLCEFEPALTALVVRFVSIRYKAIAARHTVFLESARETIACALLLSRRGSKRGPPLTIPAQPS